MCTMCVHVCVRCVCIIYNVKNSAARRRILEDKYLLSNIFSYLEVNNVIKCKKVSKLWCEIAAENFNYMLRYVCECACIIK